MAICSQTANHKLVLLISTVLVVLSKLFPDNQSAKFLIKMNLFNNVNKKIPEKYLSHITKPTKYHDLSTHVSREDTFFMVRKDGAYQTGIIRDYARFTGYLVVLLCCSEK